MREEGLAQSTGSLTRARLAQHPLVTAPADSAVLLLDHNGRIEWANDIFCTTTGYEAAELIGSAVDELLAGPAPGLTCGDAPRDTTGGSKANLHWLVRTKSGEEVWLQVHLHRFVDERGVVTGTVAVAERLHDLDLSKHELSEHARTLELANEDLTRRSQRLLTRQVELDRLVADLQANLDHVRQVADEAEQANRLKSTFLATVTHEIRTPLTAILGYAELLADCCPNEDPASDTDTRSHIATIARNAEHLLRLINDLLDLSKIEAGKLDVEFLPCSPTEIAADVCRLMQVRAKAQHTTLDVRCDGPVPALIRTDPARLRQILVNLVGNAIKFTPKGSVQLVLRYHDSRGNGSGGQMEFEVIDTGVGMTPTQIDALFEPFTQADAATARHFGGTGLGLTISLRLAQLLDGTIQVKSEPLRGSTFQLSIAADIVDENEPLAASPAGRAGVPGIHPSRAFDWPRLHGRVLVVDDSADNQRLVEFLLRKVGLDIALASNGQKAVDAALEALQSDCAFDVILMDMQMPVMDGFEATRTLRQRGYPNAIIGFTAYGTTHERDRCLAMGCNEYLCKPIDRHQLIATVQRHLLATDTRPPSASGPEHTAPP